MTWLHAAVFERLSPVSSGHHAHSEFLKLRALFRCEDGFDLAVRLLDLAMRVGPHRFHPAVPLLDDLADLLFLLRREIELLVEARDEKVGCAGRHPMWSPAQKGSIGDDSEEYAGYERREQNDRREKLRSAGANRLRINRRH